MLKWTCSLLVFTCSLSSRLFIHSFHIFGAFILKPSTKWLVFCTHSRVLLCRICLWFVSILYAEANQKRIVESGGLTSLLMLLRRYEDETVRRVAAGAIANLAMNGDVDNSFYVFDNWVLLHTLLLAQFICGCALCCCPFFCGKTEANQELIMAEGGITLLSMTASDAEDPQTLRMVAGAIANLCGNGIFCCF